MTLEEKKFNFFRNFLLYIPVKLVPACSTVLLIAYLYKVLPEGHYTSYSIALACSLMLVQLGTGWVGNSFIYFSPLADDKNALLANALLLLVLVAPIVIVTAAVVSSFFGVAGSFGIVVLLSAAQIFYFFLFSVLQARFRIREQLWATCLQVASQFLFIFVVFQFISVDYRWAVVALALGHAVGGLYAYFKLRPIVLKAPTGTAFKNDASRFYSYGAALMPWMLGVLALANADKLLVGYFEFETSDSYVSTKDLFVGASGLISMPLLMLVHPIIINKFNLNKKFEYEIISESLRYLLICFSLLWMFLHILGFELFFFFTDKKSTVSTVVLFFSYLNVFFACASIYLQKRYEVHRKWSVLAWYSVLCAALSVAAVAVGCLLFGILGASVGGALGQAAYCCIVSRGLVKKIKFVTSSWVLFVTICGTYIVLFKVKFYLGAFVAGLPSWNSIVAWIAVFIVITYSFLIYLVRWNVFSSGKE